MEGAEFRCPTCNTKVFIDCIAQEGVTVYFFANCEACRCRLRFTLDNILAALCEGVLVGQDKRIH